MFILSHVYTTSWSYLYLSYPSNSPQGPPSHLLPNFMCFFLINQLIFNMLSPINATHMTWVWSHPLGHRTYLWPHPKKSDSSSPSSHQVPVTLQLEAGPWEPLLLLCWDYFCMSFVFWDRISVCSLGWPSTRCETLVHLLHAGTTDVHCHTLLGSF